MEPLQTWERQGKIKWNPRTGMFHDAHMSEDIAGPIYLVTIRVDAVDKRPAYIIREQRAVIPSLAAKRVLTHFTQYLPADMLHVVLVRRGNQRWNGWDTLARLHAFPNIRNTRTKRTVIDANPQPVIES